MRVSDPPAFSMQKERGCGGSETRSSAVSFFLQYTRLFLSIPFISPNHKGRFPNLALPPLSWFGCKPNDCSRRLQPMRQTPTSSRRRIAATSAGKAGLGFGAVFFGCICLSASATRANTVDHPSGPQAKALYQDENAPIEQRVQDLLRRMRKSASARYVFRRPRHHGSACG
jgi:hypothetical protein